MHRLGIIGLSPGNGHPYSWSAIFKGCELIADTDAYSSFKNMLTAFVEMLGTGKPPIDWHETVETAKIVVAAILSLQENSRVVSLAEIA